MVFRGYGFSGNDFSAKNQPVLHRSALPRTGHSRTGLPRTGHSRKGLPDPESMTVPMGRTGPCVMARAARPQRGRWLTRPPLGLCRSACNAARTLQPPEQDLCPLEASAAGRVVLDGRAAELQTRNEAPYRLVIRCFSEPASIIAAVSQQPIRHWQSARLPPRRKLTCRDQKPDRLPPRHRAH